MAELNVRAERVEILQNLLIGHSTGGVASNEEYRLLREELLADSRIAPLLPRWLRTHRSLAEFWQFIKRKFSTYAQRRDFLWSEFRPALEHLESVSRVPAVEPISEGLKRFNEESVHGAWQRALDRRETDPEGAITSARALLESVCKHILDGASVEYPEDADLPRLYRLASENLKLAPSQHTEGIFRQILGGCTAVVEGLGAIRNKLGDAHGKGVRRVKPSARHAQLAVNLAGSAALFLVETWDARKAAAT